MDESGPMQMLNAGKKRLQSFFSKLGILVIDTIAKPVRIKNQTLTQSQLQVMILIACRLQNTDWQAVTANVVKAVLFCLQNWVTVTSLGKTKAPRG